MQLEQDLDRYNPAFWKSFKTAAYWKIFVYDLSFVFLAILFVKIFFSIINQRLTSLPAPEEVFMLGLTDASNFDIFFRFAAIGGIIVALVIFLLWVVIGNFSWSKVLCKKINFKEFLTLLLKLFIWSIITLFIFYLIGLFMNYMIDLIMGTSLYIYFAAAITAIVLIFIIFPAILFLISYTHIIFIKTIKKEKIGLLKNIYVPLLYMSLTFVALAIFSLLFKLLPSGGEAFLSGISLIAYYSWQKTYLFTLL